jgi:hypothetical protein
VKTAFVQLPVQSHDYGYSLENVPLAAGYLAASVSLSIPESSASICPESVANSGGDAAILKWLEDSRPDLIGFSCYVWNIDRSLYLCREIRKRLNGIILVLGGPEITSDNEFLREHEVFDFGVIGEGEETFRELVRALDGGKKDFTGIRGLMIRGEQGWTDAPARTPVRTLEDVPSPYLTGILSPSMRKSIIVETVRGCPMRCTYCYYHKHQSGVRTFPQKRIEAEFAWGMAAGVKEITMVDPCFGRRPDLMALLERLAANGPGRPSFSCELNAEDLTDELVSALVKAGLVHVEVGLQSTKEETLRNVGRRFDRSAFARGVNLLRNAGVRVMTDIMVGLPGDALDDVRRSMDFVLEGRLYDELSLYPLSVLPGTVLRAQARQFGISRQPFPPYLVTRTAWMERDDICKAFEYAEEVTGLDYFPVEVPQTGSPDDSSAGAWVGRIVIDAGGKDEPVRPEEIGQSLCIEVRDPRFMAGRDSLRKKLRDLLTANPYTLVTWIVPDACIADPEVIPFVSTIAPRIDHPSDREYMSTTAPLKSCRLFIRSPLAGGEAILTQIPLSRDDSRPLWAYIPASAGPDQERMHTARIEALLGYAPGIRFHDFPNTKAAPGMTAVRKLSL